MMYRLIALLLLALSTGAWARSPEVGQDGAPIIVLDGPITGATIRPILDYLQAVAAHPEEAMKESKYIDMVIDSPGGSVVAGFIMLGQMQDLQARGFVFRCYVDRVAASMAFQTLLQCDERHALTRSFLLWHRARIFVGGLFGSAMTAPMADALAKQLQLTDDDIFYDLQHRLVGADDEYIKWHFEQETLHTGLGLHAALPKFLTAHRSIPGLAEAMASDKTIRTVKAGFFDAVPGDIIYIWKQYPIYLRGTLPVPASGGKK